MLVSNRVHNRKVNIRHFAFQAREQSKELRWHSAHLTLDITNVNICI